jgi:hypothetical protein
MSIRNAMPSLKFTPRCTLHLHSTSCDVWCLTLELQRVWKNCNRL